MSEELAEYLFHQGTNYKAYDYMGCNLVKRNGKYYYTFRTWAPNAVSLELISDFTSWKEGAPMHKVSEKGVWEITIERDKSLEGLCYKFKIISPKGILLKGDPYARYSRGGDDGGSIIFSGGNFRWTDAAWLKYRKSLVKGKQVRELAYPINIYEVHLPSFMRKENGDYLTYDELADNLLSYVKLLGFTHVEIMPIQEFPYDGSWGYQSCAFYAPTSRLGTPDDFKSFVDKLHSAGIGVLLDWVCAHFPKDAWGLFEYDGTYLYEYQGSDRIESKSWGTRFFDIGREEVQSFLISNALYFLREFHLDGLRVDAVASMLYLDYDRQNGEWTPNVYGTNENLEAIAFFKKLNGCILSEFADVIMIAEEAGTYQGTTSSLDLGGLGFHLKWNMGFANDLYDYLSTDPIFRQFKHKALNFPIMYAFKEKYCLPISHDEVVHGKRSFINKMFGSYEEKFSTARAALLLYMTYPGKKLMFMGTEYAQFKEWAYNESLEWFMLEYTAHREFFEYVRALNCFYLDNPPLWDDDFSESGFEWILPDEAEKNLVAYRRLTRDNESFLIAIISFSGVSQSVEIPIESGKRYDIVFESENNPGKNVTLQKGKKGKMCFEIPALHGVIIKESADIIKLRI